MLRSGSFSIKSDEMSAKRKSFFSFRKKSSMDLHLKIETRSLSTSVSSSNLSSKYLQSLEGKENRLNKRSSSPNLSGLPNRTQKVKPLGTSLANIERTNYKHTNDPKRLSCCSSISPSSNSSLSTDSMFKSSKNSPESFDLYDNLSQITDFETEYEETLIHKNTPTSPQIAAHLDFRDTPLITQNQSFDKFSVDSTNDEYVFTMSTVQNIVILSVAEQDKTMTTLNIDYTLAFDDDYNETIVL